MYETMTRGWVRLTKLRLSARTKLLLKLAGTILACAIILHQIAPAAVIARLVNLRPGPVIAVVFVLGAQLILLAWRWQFILERIEPDQPRVRLIDLFWLVGAGILYGQLLPSTIGGDVVRGTMLAQKINLRAAAVSILMDRLTGLAALLLLIVAFAPLIVWRMGTGGRALDVTAAGLVALAVGCLVLLWSAYTFAPLLFSKLWPLLERIPEWRLRLLNSFGAIAIGSGILAQLASVALIYLLGQASGVELRFVDCLLLVPPALLLSALPISINGWGVREGVLAGGFALIGVPASDIVTVSILYGLTGPATGLLFGAQSLLRLRWRPT